nr:PAAR domain-containing protein [candidate division Zixibacteria bacterium]
MPGKPAARVGDPTAHGGTILPSGAPTVLIGGMPAARMGDMHVCPAVNPGTPPPPHVGMQIIATCTSVLIAGMPAARVGDTALCSGPPSSIVSGCMTVLIGDGGGGGGGGGGGAGKKAGAEAEEAEVKEGHYIDAKVVDKGGKPIVGGKYRIKLPDGSETSGPLTGQVKKSGIDEGNCDIALQAITKAAWSEKQAAVGDKVKLQVETAGVKSGTPATLEIFIRDANFADRMLDAIETKLKGDKIEEEWELKVDEKLLKINESKEEQGGYSMPSYYFRAKIGDLLARSGILDYQDYIELKIKDDEGNPVKGAKYKVFLTNGAVRQGTLDDNGYAKVERVPPGQVRVVVDPRT